MKLQLNANWHRLRCSAVLIVGLLTLLSSGSFGQDTTATIKGRLVDGSNRSAVPFATVAVLSLSDSSLVKGSLTDTAGAFVVADLKTGNYIVQYSSVEYKTVKQNVQIGQGQPEQDLGIIDLAKEVKMLSEVNVVGQKLAFTSTTEGILINVNNNLFKTSTNVIDVLKRSPSIQVKDDGSLLMRNSVTPRVLINGRAIPMSSDELRNYLNTLKPSEVESIEVITNPSAKYDAEFKGVVNIRLKRNEEVGVRGSLTTNYQQNRYANSTNNANLTFRTNKAAYTLRGGYSKSTNFEDATTTQVLQDKSLMFTRLFVPHTNKTVDLMAGVDYYLSKKQVIGGQLRYFNNTVVSPYRFDISLNPTLNRAQNIVSFSDITTKNKNYSANLYYENVTNKGTLSFLTSGVWYNNGQNQLIQTIDSAGTLKLRGAFANETKNASAQLDYSPTLKRGKLEFGSRMAYTNIGNLSGYNQLVSDRWVADTVNSNTFQYRELSIAAYTSFAGTLKKVAYSVGLRVENTQTEGNSLTLRNVVKRNYTKLLPSVNVNIPMSASSQLNLSYSRRLSRPSFSALNPYVYIGGPYSSYRGNQFLIPITSSSYSVNYNLKKLTVAANFGVNYDDIQQVPHYDPTTNRTEYIYENLASNKYRGIEVGYPLKLNRWWSVQHTFKYYENDYTLVFDLPYFEGTVKTSVNYVALSSDHSFTLPKGYNVSVTGQWETGGGTALFNLRPKGYVNIGLQKTFSKVLNATLNVNDLFYTYRVVGESTRPDLINLSNTNRFGSRYVSLQLSYSFGKSSYSGKQVRNSSEEEENRARR